MPILAVVLSTFTNEVGQFYVFNPLCLSAGLLQKYLADVIETWRYDWAYQWEKSVSVQW